MPIFNDTKDTSLHEGARKAALLLSILDPDVVEKLLELFEPRVVDAIVEEAKRVKVEQTSLDEVEEIVNEFLTSFGVDDRELASALLDEAKRTMHERSLNGVSDNGVFNSENDSKEQIPVSSLDVFDPNKIVDALRGERPTIISGVLSLVSQQRRSKILRQLEIDVSKTYNDSLLAAIKRSFSRLVPTSSMKTLESLFFEHMLEK